MLEPIEMKADRAMRETHSTTRSSECNSTAIPLIATTISISDNKRGRRIVQMHMLQSERVMHIHSRNRLTNLNLAISFTI